MTLFKAKYISRLIGEFMELMMVPVNYYYYPLLKPRGNAMAMRNALIIGIYGERK